MPKISVIMGVYKEKTNYLNQAIESIIQQIFGDFEFLIVLDDPDNLELLKVLKYYEAKDNRIKVFINEKNIGLALSLNRVISIAQGKYLARMDADDISLPNRFMKQIIFLDTHPEISVLGTNKIIIDKDGMEISKGHPLPKTSRGVAMIMKYSNIITHPSVMMRNDAVNEIGGYRDFPTTQDYDLWSRFLTAGKIIHNLDEYLIKYRINPSGVTMRQSYKQALVEQYIRLLEKERKYLAGAKDDFSRDKLDLYLNKNNVYDQIQAMQYQEARMLFENGRVKLKKHHFISGVLMILKASKKHHMMPMLLFKQIISLLIKKIT